MEEYDRRSEVQRGENWREELIPKYQSRFALRITNQIPFLNLSQLDPLAPQGTSFHFNLPQKFSNSEVFQRLKPILAEPGEEGKFFFFLLGFSREFW